jgi:hypothetical protein
MRPHFRIIAFLACCIPLISCGGYSFVGFVSNPGGNTSLSGRVGDISSGFVSDPSGITPVTFVTFMTSDAAVKVYFCGDQRQLFSINQNVRVDYTAGVACSVLVRVVVVEESAISSFPDAIPT